jgi:RNA polymerase sigma-70 factor (ECF subfamily)
LDEVTGGLSDSQLIVASWEDGLLFGEIFRRHYPVVYGFVVGLVGSSDGTDLAAEVFVRAFEGRRRFKPAYTSARPWLMGIAANLVRGHYRKKSREGRALRRFSKLPSWEEDFEDSSANRVDAFRMRSEIADALASLRPEEHQVVTLFVFADFSYSEIAQAMNISEGTVRSRLSRARARLRNLIGGWDQPSMDDQP